MQISVTDAKAQLTQCERRAEAESGRTKLFGQARDMVDKGLIVGWMAGVEAGP